MRFRLRTLMIISLALVCSYLGSVFLGRHFSGPSGQFAPGINIGAVLGAIVGISLGTFLACRHVQTDMRLPGMNNAFRLTIREIGLLTVIVALTLGWILDHQMLRAYNQVWVNWTYVLGDRLEDHGETVRKKKDGIYYLRKTDSDSEQPYWSGSRRILDQGAVPQPNNPAQGMAPAAK